MTMRRAFCYLFHWRRQWREADTHYYGWRCGVCGERWRVERAVGEQLDEAKK